MPTSTAARIAFVLAVTSGVPSCTSSAPLVDDALLDARQSIDEHTEEGRAPLPPILPVLAESTEAWVWVESEELRAQCYGGCGVPDAVGGVPPFAVACVDASRLEARRDGDHGWRATLAVNDAVEPRIFECGSSVFVAYGAIGDSEYGVWQLDGRRGETLATRTRALAGTLEAPPQISCAAGTGLLVYSKQRVAGRSVLAVDAFDADARVHATRVLPGELAALEPEPEVFGVSPQSHVINGHNSYRFVTRGAAKGNRGARAADRWPLEASHAGRVRWTAPVGPRQAPRLGGNRPLYGAEIDWYATGTMPDAHVFEIGASVIVALDRELIALDRDSGALQWRIHTAGLVALSRGHDGERPWDSGLGLIGCGGCARAQIRVAAKGDLVAFDVRSALEHYVEVVDPSVGAVLVRRVRQ
ncbi:MAG: hypothetical protein IPK74_02805 [Deltaproteobacteria bacterium]|nr:hypothetical protein [Deltaproteobacteria bacterium]